MAALVQSYPQQSSTITMLQRHSSATDPFQTGSQNQQQLRNTQMARGIYGPGNIVTSYRGHTTVPPVAPYAFTSAPIIPAAQAASNTQAASNAQTGANPLRQHPISPYLRQENRAASAPTITLAQQNTLNGSTAQARQRPMTTPPSTVPVTISSDNIATTYQAAAMDDSDIPTQRSSASRPLSAMELNISDAKLAALGNAPKPSPDRYRRNNRRMESGQPPFGSQQPAGSAMPSGSGMATVGHLYNHPTYPGPSTNHGQQTYRGAQMLPNKENMPGFDTRSRLVSKDDMALNRQVSSEQAKRYRRRSITGLEAGGFNDSFVDPRQQQLSSGQPRTYASVVSSPHTPEKADVRSMTTIASNQQLSQSHGRTGSDDKSVPQRLGTVSFPIKREPVDVASSNPTVLHGTSIAKHEAKLVDIPPRASSDASKRITNPSPLSKPMASESEASPTKPSVAQQQPAKSSQPQPTPVTLPTTTTPDSPAAQHLAALNKKEGKKEGKSSRLRRAFSFGSAAELRKASAENTHNNNATAERARLKKERYEEDHDAEQAAIVQKQEAGGLGEGIYSGQGHFFTGSTDNLSISSTASSASIMLRKMGKGVKKSTRSLVGLFRPKSVIGVPAADAAVPEPSLAQVSMVTVEAEREKVNVNADPHDQAGGGTGYPRLERNSMESGSMEPLSFSDRTNDSFGARRSIVGGERERAEVLAAVKKGILKRNESGNFSPLNRSADNKYTGFTLPQIPRVSDSPDSSAPGTPGDDQPRGHRRTDSVTIEGEDYFMSLARFAGTQSNSMPGTPRSLAARNISFSPRIQFHDTWPSGEYDRRGEIATCNRLTPMLAQQIKEELNSFKMEMEVHEESKLNTHFF